MSGSDATSCNSNSGGKWSFFSSSAGLSFSVFAITGGSGSAATGRNVLVNAEMMATRVKTIKSGAWETPADGGKGLSE